VLAALLQLGASTHAATVPSGFVDSIFVAVPSDATAMKFSPDGRLFVCQQSGKLRVVQNGTLLATPFLTLTVHDGGERGLLGIAFDPDFQTVAFPVTRSVSSAAPVSVAWKTTNGSAKSGSDYAAGSGTVTFPAGSTLRTIAVTIHGDTAVETKEVFYIDLSAPLGATIADARAVGSIKNDDGAGTIVFSAWKYQRTENGGNAKITATRSGGLVGGMTVRYSTANGIASAGTDYTATSGTLTFGAGVESASFQVPITNDARDEVNETVNLSLSTPAGGAVLGTRRTAVLSIGVTVHYATSAGTASATADYTPASGMLSFAAGQTSASFAAAIRDDTINEANETVNLALANPTGGAHLGSRPTAVLTILDNE